MTMPGGSSRALGEIFVPVPESTAWTDILHWCVAVMNRDDSDLAFTASLLSHAIGYAGLTPKQAKYADKIHERIVSLYRLGELDCQRAPRPRAQSAMSEPAGHA